MTVSRWVKVAGQRARQRRQEGAWAGVVSFSGMAVADATAVCVRGKWHTVHMLNDALSRVVLQLERLVDASETYLAGRFRVWLANWGIPWQSVQVLVTDGASGYYGVLNLVLRRTWQPSAAEPVGLCRLAAPCYNCDACATCMSCARTRARDTPIR